VTPHTEPDRSRPNQVPLGQRQFQTAIATQDTLGLNANPLAGERYVATHLAGHAVVAMLHHIDIHHMALGDGADGHWVGRVDWSHRWIRPLPGGLPSRRQRRACRELMFAYLGGRCAALLEGFGWPGPTFTLDYAAADTEQVIALAEVISPAAPGRVIQSGIRHVTAVVCDPVIWTSIQHLADLMISERVLSGVDATDVIKEVMRQGSVV